MLSDKDITNRIERIINLFYEYLQHHYYTCCIVCDLHAIKNRK